MKIALPLRFSPLRGVLRTSRLLTQAVEQWFSQRTCQTPKSPHKAGFLVFGTNEWIRTTDPHHVKVVL